MPEGASRVLRRRALRFRGSVPVPRPDTPTSSGGIDAARIHEAVSPRLPSL
jgi:hypothetical protein